MKLHLTMLVISLSGLAAGIANACSSCGCSLSSDWVTQGISRTPGISIDLRYDFIDQTALRHGNNPAESTAIPSGEEVEKRSTNRYFTTTLGYTVNKDWGISLVIPYLDRSHSTFAEKDTELSLSHSRSLSDIKLIGRYQGLSENGDTGVLMGVKLPSGSEDYRFNAGPQAGEPLDRSLQPGSGSTDLILGGFRYGSLSRDWDWYTQGLVQAPVAIMDHFRPGAVVSVNGGWRYMAAGRWTPQLQINVLARRHDSGDNGDAGNSGGRSVYLSPGLSLQVVKRVSANGFVQIPVVQHVSGMQIAPRWSATFGITAGFD